MPHWVLNCKHCTKPFVHSTIDPSSNRLPYDPLWPPRPEFPSGGMTMDCPDCLKSSLYQRFELLYRAG